MVEISSGNTSEIATKCCWMLQKTTFLSLKHRIGSRAHRMCRGGTGLSGTDSLGPWNTQRTLNQVHSSLTDRYRPFWNLAQKSIFFEFWSFGVIFWISGLGAVPRRTPDSNRCIFAGFGDMDLIRSALKRWDFGASDGRNFERQHLRNFYQMLLKCC